MLVRLSLLLVLLAAFATAVAAAVVADVSPSSVPLPLPLVCARRLVEHRNLQCSLELAHRRTLVHGHRRLRKTVGSHV